MASTQSTQTGKDQKSNRGFASMDADKQREIASKGGQAAHEKGTAHEFTSEEARAAGRKGGENSRGGRAASAARDDASTTASASKNSADSQTRTSGTRGGTPEQHAEAGRQSHKNS